MSKRLRQVVLVARELDAALDELTSALGIRVAYHDPGVKLFGLKNAVLPVGDTFLEVVSPIQDDAPAARYLARHGSDGGYMLMIQTDELPADRARLERLGVRTAWSAELDDIASVHLHPRDTGGAILSLDRPVPPDSWRWAGPRWRELRRTDVSRALVGATLASPDPAALARRWGEVLDLPVAGDAIALQGGALRFVAGEAERLVGFDVECADRGRAGERLELVGVAVRRV